MAATREDFPADGYPTRPTSAMLFSSRTASNASPGSPSSAKPGALRRVLASAALPRPPLPPAASTTRVPAPTRSASWRPSAVLTTVPAGTRSTASSPRAPCRLLPAPGRPLPAFWCGRWWKSSSVCTFGSTSRTTLPPGPPFPPSGPPSGLNFSRCTEATPLPPRPPVTCRLTRSTNVGTAIAYLLPRRQAWTSSVTPVRTPLMTPAMTKGRPAFSAGRPFAAYVFRPRPSSLGSGDDVDDAATALRAELDVAADQREQGVVPAAADPAAGVEVGAALAHDDLAGVDELAAVPLDAQPLGVGVPTVLGRGRALLVCHEFSPSSCERGARSGADLGHLDLGVLLAMTLALPVTGLVLVLQDRDLRALGGPEDLGGHARGAEGVGSGGDVLAVDEHEHGKRDRV